MDLALHTDNPLPGFFLLKEVKPSYRDSYQPPAHQLAVQSMRFMSQEEYQRAIEAEYRLVPQLPVHVDGGASDGGTGGGAASAGVHDAGAVG